MSDTLGVNAQQSAFPDGHLFIGAKAFTDSGGFLTITNPSLGIVQGNIGAGDASVLFTDVKELLFRTGVYASGASQRAFGTAGPPPVPGPSLVAGTSGPLALTQGIPPIPGAKLNTVAGSLAGPTPKGVQINSYDVIYGVTGAAAALATTGLTQTIYKSGLAPVVNPLVAIAANGLLLPVTAHPIIVNVPVPVPAMLTAADESVVLNLALTAGGGGSIQFYGVNLNISFNFN